MIRGVKVKNKKTVITAAVCIAVIAGIFVLAFAGSSGSIKVVFPSLGKADCAILYEDGACVVIDCGNKGDGKGVADLCASLGAEKIDCLIITHFDKDHIGGAAKLLTSIHVAKVYEPDYDDSEVDINEYSLYRLALENAVAEGTELIKLGSDEKIAVGGMELTLMPPHKSYDKSIDNNSSLVVLVSAYGKRLLFAGDIEKQRIDDMLAEYDLKCDFLKMPHHGEYGKSVSNLIKACSPSAAVVTCENREELDPSLENALASAGVNVYYTDTGKTLYFTCRKNGIDHSEE